MTSRRSPRAWSKSNSSRDLRAGNRAARMRPSPPKDLTLHRFFAGVARKGVTDFHPGGADRNAADAVLDFTIALEALLLPYDEKARHGDLGYRFRVHGATSWPMR
jgi:hypothetical protein